MMKFYLFRILVYKTIRLDSGADSLTTMIAYIYKEADKEGVEVQGDDRCLFTMKLSFIRFDSILVLITQSKTKAWKVVNHTRVLSRPLEEQGISTSRHPVEAHYGCFGPCWCNNTSRR
jgi:hypothetical protein